MIEHELLRQAPQHVLELDHLLATDVELNVPAERRDAFRQRLDHFGLDDRGGRVTKTEADPAHASVVESLQLGVRAPG